MLTLLLVFRLACVCLSLLSIHRFPRPLMNFRFVGSMISLASDEVNFWTCSEGVAPTFDFAPALSWNRYTQPLTSINGSPFDLRAFHQVFVVVEIHGHCMVFAHGLSTWGTMVLHLAFCPTRQHHLNVWHCPPHFL